MANYICNLKDDNTEYKIKCEILNRTKSNFNTNLGCRLCNLEKKIDKSEKNITLNKKSKRQIICNHYQKYFFSKTKTNSILNLSKIKPRTRAV